MRKSPNFKLWRQAVVPVAILYGHFKTPSGYHDTCVLVSLVDFEIIFEAHKRFWTNSYFLFLFLPLWCHHFLGGGRSPCPRLIFTGFLSILRVLLKRSVRTVKMIKWSGSAAASLTHHFSIRKHQNEMPSTLKTTYFQKTGSFISLSASVIHQSGAWPVFPSSQRGHETETGVPKPLKETFNLI